MAQKTIRLITCFFGKLPWYFEYFVHSCRYNPTVDFLIITDDMDYKKPLPQNMELVRWKLQSVVAFASDKLGFSVCIDNGYKMCDFKPAYGVIFSEYLKNYDFWGHTDIDIIFGDIREFITDEILTEYDVISVRPDWLTGCFLLYRNVDNVTRLFTHSRDYKKVFTSPVHYCFDETNFAHDAFSNGASYLHVNTEIESMMHVVSRLEAENQVKVYYDLHIIEGLPGRLKWENGKMFFRNKYEVMCYHMIYFKRRCIPVTVKNIPQSFTLSPTRIYHHHLKENTNAV